MTKRNNYQVPIYFSFVLVSAILILFGCQWDPDHNNPFDPNYIVTDKTSMQVQVLSRDSAEDMPVIGASIQISTLGRIATTDSTGWAKILEIPLGRWWVSAYRDTEEQPNYARDSIEITTTLDTPNSTSLRLNALPIPEKPSLHVQVMNRDFSTDFAINKATVQIADLGRFATTDTSGWVHFLDMPVGDYWVAAFRENGEEPIYAIDSVQTTISANMPTTTRMRLDALPHFTSISATAVTLRRRLGDNNYVKKIRLKSIVNDRDGATDLKSVEWRFREMTGELNYNQEPDSAFWEAEISAEEFAGGIGDAMNAPFYITASDGAGNSVQADTTLARILQSVPDISDPTPEANPDFRWVFYWYDEFDNLSDFKYLLKIWRDDLYEPVVVYDTTLTPQASHETNHIVDMDLDSGDYFSYLFVVDNFGNYARTEKKRIVITD